MTNELVSVLLDGECSASELKYFLDDVAESPALMQQWSRMILVRDAMAGIPIQNSRQVDPDKFCAGIMAQLGEMSPAADGRIASNTDFPTRSKVFQIASRASKPPSAARRRARSMVGSWMGPKMGWAAAASVTLVALAGGRSWIISGSQPAPTSSAIDIAAIPDSSTSGGFRPAVDNGTSPFGLMPVSVRYSMGSIGDATGTRWAQLDPEAGPRVALADRYHLNLDRSIAGLHGYGRLASTWVSYELPPDSH